MLQFNNLKADEKMCFSDFKYFEIHVPLKTGKVDKRLRC